MRKLVLLISGALLLMAVTCERPVDVFFPDQKSELVIISNITEGRDVQVQVSLTRSLDEPSGIDYIINADVKLLEGEIFLQKLKFVQPTVGTPYFTTENFQPLIGKTYFIQVDVPGYDRLIASTTIPRQTPIKQIELQNMETTILSENLKEFSFDFQVVFDDPPGEANYYHLKIFQQFEKFSILRNDTVFHDTTIRELQFNSAQNNNFQVAHYEGGLLIEDTPFDGLTKYISVPLKIQVATNEELPGKIIAELRTISEPYYLFYSSVSRQRLAPTSPIAEPILIFNNIENGNGVFAGYSQVIDSVAIRSY